MEKAKLEVGSSGVKRAWTLRDEAIDENFNPDEMAKRLRGEINDGSSYIEVG